MTNALTPTQQSVLKMASKREDRAIRWPERLKGGAIKKVAESLIGTGLAHYEGDVLIATDAGLRAVGAGPDSKPVTEDKPRDSKQAQLIEMLKRSEGASIAEIVAAFGWQAHTVRGAIAGALKKKLGLAVTSEKIEGRGRVYAIRTEG